MLHAHAHTHTFNESDHPQRRRLPIPRIPNLLKQRTKFNVSAVHWGVSSVAQPSQFRVTWMVKPECLMQRVLKESDDEESDKEEQPGPRESLVQGCAEFSESIPIR